MQNSPEAQEIQIKIQDQVKIIQKQQENLTSAITKRQTLDSQLRENEAVLTELNLLKDNAQVFKQHGPSLIQLPVNEAKSNVEKRLEFIRGEIKRVDQSIEESEKLMESQKQSIVTLRQKLMSMLPQGQNVQNQQLLAQ